MGKFDNIKKFLDSMAEGMSTNNLSNGVLEDAETFGKKIKDYFDAEIKTAGEEAKKRYENLQREVETNPDKYKVVLSDAYNNEMLRIGAQADAFNQFDSYTYGGDNLYNWMLSVSMYMTSWVFRNIIDQQAADIVSHGFKLDIKVDDKKVRKLIKQENKLNYEDRVEPAVSSEDVSQVYDTYDEMIPELINLVAWGKMFGGAAALVLDSGLDPKEYYRPLDETGFHGEPRLFVADRWNKMSVSADNVSDVSDMDFGTPVYYNFYLPDGSMCVAHHSRVLRYSNKKGPSIIEQMLQGWGIPELQHLFQELNRNEKLKNTITSLISKWNLEILKIQGMRQFMQGALSEQAAAQLDAKLEMINRYRSFNSLIFLDKNDDYVRQDGSTMTGLSEILKVQKSEVCGAAKMPLVLLYGDQEKGLSGNADDDMRLYDNRIQAEKNGEYRKALRKLIRILALKYEFHPSFTFKIKFNSIIEPTLKDKISNSTSILGAYQTLKTMGIYTDTMIARELKAYNDHVIFGQELTDDAIAKLDKGLKDSSDDGFGEEAGGELDLSPTGDPALDVPPELQAESSIPAMEEPALTASPAEMAGAPVSEAPAGEEVFTDIDVDTM